MTARTQPAPIGTVLDALTAGPYVPRLADLAQPPRVGRPRAHPPWVLFVYAALTRHFRSAHFTDIELEAGLLGERVLSSGEPELEAKATWFLLSDGEVVAAFHESGLMWRKDERQCQLMDFYVAERRVWPVVTGALGDLLP